ncbi:hypothetical protein M6B38_111965 [Iris pallida]|uniref:RING-type domain-containing protein n=1 Tax=Iris pallida TaxID=29817 RepID=A0AAX6DNC6_IRIPA|nr:hypothetical protein M6B38_111965 [Iris pallida]
MSDLGVLEPMDLEKPDLSEEMKSSATSLSSASSCSICLELVLDRERATAKLHCGHEFHLGDRFHLEISKIYLCC